MGPKKAKTGTVTEEQESPKRDSDSNQEIAGSTANQNISIVSPTSTKVNWKSDPIPTLLNRVPPRRWALSGVANADLSLKPVSTGIYPFEIMAIP